jgi:hypothetical protein
MSKILLFIAIVAIIYGFLRVAYSELKLHKLHKAMSELHKMQIDEWEVKWGEFVQEEYNKCTDPYRQEIEENMEFFRKELEELNKGDNNE